ncbi:MAG: TIGR04442 family protein [Nitrospirae bacterium]|nr:TIGR04442 family protein [Nitrospirota bacterium]
MIYDLRFHGKITPQIEFFSLIGGADISAAYFYEKGDSYVRFFFKGNEFRINSTGVSYNSTGGSFCEYMFGVEQPIKDLQKRDIKNRLVMFGAISEGEDKITFTNNTRGSESFEQIFRDGNAVTNYYFFVSSDYQGELKKRQEIILKSVGKFIKRTELMGEGKDTDLLEQLIADLAESKSNIFLFKLINKENEEYYKAFQKFYFKEKTLSPESELLLEDITSRYRIDRYQQERMKIDVMYSHPENKRIVDEYKDILIEMSYEDVIHPSRLARLQRLRTLSIRNNIPIILFDTLDELLLKGKKILESKEPEYIKETRAIIENLFFKDASLKSHIVSEDIVKLIRARHNARSKSDMSFERVILDAGRACDEIARETNTLSLLEELSSILTYFDRYDNIFAHLNKLAFSENINFTENPIRSLIGNKKAFDSLNYGLFDELFVKDLLGNKYLSSYGRKKLTALIEGLKKIEEGNATYREIVAIINKILKEEKLYSLLHAAMKEKMRSFFPGLDLKENRKEIKEEICGELAAKGFKWAVSDRLFERVLFDLKKESFYLNHLLPLVIHEKNVSLREDFLDNSGLDRFYIESLERDYLENKGLSLNFMDELKEGQEPSVVR